jgi:hypothetical protein
MTTWPATDLVARIKKLPAESALAREEMGDMADWSSLAENVAKLVDLMTAWLHYEYASWTTDPDDVEAQRKARKRAGIKPPPKPLIPPVAARPQSLHDRLVDDYLTESAQYQLPESEGPRMVTSDEFDALMGL